MQDLKNKIKSTTQSLQNTDLVTPLVNGWNSLSNTLPKTSLFQTTQASSSSNYKRLNSSKCCTFTFEIRNEIFKTKKKSFRVQTSFFSFENHAFKDQIMFLSQRSCT